ncbi:MAG: AAA family ATPase [Acidobacteria bacterium]|nr:AAA family ATPase [Acidobacteriota bacterium]
MLRLQKVELVGFKSFAERTRIVFNGSGVAGVVGPNGCGKSNISDAILWVLGEQSAKTLRSSRMADCIFNGTATRPPTNLAEVTLTLVDPEAEKTAGEAAAEAPAETVPAGQEAGAGAEAGRSDKKRKNRLNLRILPGEVVVTRRLYRDGTSEYYLNGELCRLRDIQELFMGTGLGPESYAIIEQGRIGQILSSRPSDRRAIIEEAAAVSKYKTKRRLAEAKLAAAQQNLLRVNDILEEITKQLNSLKRQASRARRYQELKAEGAELRRRLLATQLEQFRAAEASLGAQLEANGAEINGLAATLAAFEQEHAAGQARQYELEAALRQEQNRAGQVLVELERAYARLADIRRQQQEATARLTALTGQRQSLGEEAAGTTGATEENRRLIARLEADFAAAVQDLGRLAADTELVWRETVGGPGQAILDDLEPVARARAWRARAQEVVTGVERAVALCQKEREAEERRVDELRQSLAAALAQEKALDELLTHRAVFAEPVQKLLVGAGAASAGVEFRAVGVVADFAQFEPEYAPLLEDYLHDELEYVVVETYEAARTGVSLLRDQVAGRATFLVDSFGRLPPKLADEARQAPQGRGIIGSVADFVHLNGALGSEAKRVLPRLGRTYLVESPRRAEELARDYPNHFFLSTDGTCYHGRLVSGGARNGHGAHALQRELEQAARRRTEIEPLTGSAESRLRELEARRRGLDAALESARRALLGHERNLVQLEQQQEALPLARQEQARLEELARRAGGGRQQLDTEESELCARQERLIEELRTGEGEAERRRKDREAQEQRCQEFDAELTGLRERRLAGDATLRERRGQVDALRERRHALEVECARQETERQHAALAAQSEFGLRPEELCAQVAERLNTDELALAEARYREIKERLETLGPINMMALEEFQECEQRYEFLTKQKDDLLASIADTTGTINEIDTVSRQQFERAFAVINQNFAETFRTLFGGGTATLRLSEGEEAGEAGIDLICQPPGKRLQNVLLLSGGEKALAALALLIGIFRYQPSPFCILDEVDAPLDDSNVGRFTQLIQEMAPQTQFILITHNKKTMEIAPVLYGVTMQGAVSQIVSVRFDDAAPAA